MLSAIRAWFEQRHTKILGSRLDPIERGGVNCATSAPFDFGESRFEAVFGRRDSTVKERFHESSPHHAIVVAPRDPHACFFLGTAACEVTSGADVLSRATRDLRVATPEAVGMSSDRLARAFGGHAGHRRRRQARRIVTMVARRGKVVHFETFGHQDIESATPMKQRRRRAAGS